MSHYLTVLIQITYLRAEYIYNRHRVKFGLDYFLDYFLDHFLDHFKGWSTPLVLREGWDEVYQC